MSKLDTVYASLKIWRPRLHQIRVLKWLTEVTKKCATTFSVLDQRFFDPSWCTIGGQRMNSGRWITRYLYLISIQLPVLTHSISVKFPEASAEVSKSDLTANFFFHLYIRRFFNNCMEILEKECGKECTEDHVCS